MPRILDISMWCITNTCKVLKHILLYVHSSSYGGSSPTEYTARAHCIPLSLYIRTYNTRIFKSHACSQITWLTHQITIHARLVRIPTEMYYDLRRVHVECHHNIIYANSTAHRIINRLRPERMCMIHAYHQLLKSQTKSHTLLRRV